MDYFSLNENMCVKAVCLALWVLIIQLKYEIGLHFASPFSKQTRTEKGFHPPVLESVL